MAHFGRSFGAIPHPWSVPGRRTGAVLVGAACSLGRGGARGRSDAFRCSQRVRARGEAVARGAALGPWLPSSR
eukprot:229037-Chlamydomonas_euryale.AAC.1